MAVNQGRHCNFVCFCCFGLWSRPDGGYSADCKHATKAFSHSSELSMQRTLIGLIAGLACLGAVTQIAEAAEQKTVEGLYQDKAKLGGHEVQVRGKVVKVNTGVMKRNFLHIQDGTGKQGSNVLTETSQETAEIGDEVVVTGKLAVDKDFGAGYTFPILLEESHITKGK